MWCLVISILLVCTTSTTGDNLITRIRSNVTATMSSIWDHWNAYKAIDGDDDSDPNKCHCCSGTTKTPLPSWWRIDLRDYYLIQTILFTGRNDGSRYQSQNFRIYTTFRNQGNQSSPIYENSASGSKRYSFNISLSPPVLLRYLEITNEQELSICEIKLIESTAPCSVSFYGVHCDQKCHCSDRLPCDRTTGKCQSPGCLPGWTSDSCHLACAAGKFGQDCRFPCRCFDNQTCDGSDGSCPVDKCAPGWTETNCSVSEDLITRIRPEVTATMSSVWHSWNASKAIDGIDTPQPESCNCCSGTHFRPSWWRLDLGNYYLIETIVFTGRNDDARSQSQNFKIYNKFRDQGDTTSPIYTNHASASQYNFVIALSTPVLLRYLEITNTIELTICEIKLIESTSPCPVGLFGEHCDQECHCNDRQPCNRTTGICQSAGCLPGWKGVSCHRACDAGRFGHDCGFPCRCFDNQTCNGTDGSCPGDKCAPGWTETNCSVVCNAGTFGQGCSFHCHCNVSQTCNHINGSCPPWDQCSVGWTGNNCSKDTNLIKRIRPRVRVSSSQPHWQNWTADKAIDFIESSEPNTCDCCSGSTYGNASWRINFGATYPIKIIVFIGRSDDGSSQSRGFSIYDDFQNRTLNRTLIYKNNDTTTTGYQYVIRFNSPRILQYVEISSPRILSICELRFIESERCPPGYFGEHCTEHCHCNDSLPCERSTGTCQNPGCASGWQGDACNETCDWGFYGDACASQCHCLNNVSCESVSGNCSNRACAPGWQGIPTCSEECDWGSFGNSCAQHCHCYQNASCYNVNGTCSNRMCASGWKTHSCSEICDWGSFGSGCFNHCHCFENASCDNVNGTCSNGACAAGWQGLSCSEVCPAGMFGQNCNSSCHCLQNNSCNPINGHCSSGLCSPGWREQNCSIACGSDTFGEKCSAQCHCLHGQECDHISGKCPSNVCAPGWQYQNCSAVCDAGKFGGSCMSECHCLDGHPCHHVDGSCTPELCAPGWWKSNCSIACANNTYGQNCNSSCHCDTCNHISGSCETRTCYRSWKGMYCNVSAVPLKQDEPDSSPAVIIGPVVAVVVLVAVAAAVLFYRRHTSKKKQDKASNVLTDLNNAQPTTSVNKTPLSVVKPKKKEAIQGTSQAVQEATGTQDDHMYYSYCTTTNTIQIPDLWDYISQTYNDNFTKMHLEFKKLPSGLVRDCQEASRPENTRKNRYRGMVAYDHSRVVLHRDDPSATTYINACYIDGFTRPKRFIAAQGPQESTVDDFLEMVVQQNASLIVMLTNVIEIGSRKCVQYWPTEEDEEIQFNDITITTANISTFPDYIIRELNVSKAGKKPHRITQVHFTAWPDKDVPDAAWHLVNVWRKVNTLNGNKTEPIVVHCSAGVGRSGTFIALDILHAQARTEGCIQPLHIVTNMRNQRVNMVQTKDQYVFLHEAIAESLYLGVKPMKTRDFEDLYTSLLEKDTVTGEIGLEQQFLFLQQMKPTDEESEYYNITLNESDEYRPKATTSATAARLDLCHIQNYTGKETFIVSRAPPNNDDIPQNLLNVIRNRNIKTIINLHIGKGNSDRTGHSNSMNEKKEMYVELLETKRQKNFIEKTFELRQQNSPREGRELKQFVFLMWRDGTAVPSDTSTVIELLNAVQRWQPSTEEAQPILVVCEFGDERSGLVCGLLIEFERIRIKEEVNLLETVKAMKQRNPQLIPNYVQYKYCHSAVLDYIRQSDVYMNV